MCIFLAYSNNLSFSLQSYAYHNRDLCVQVSVYKNFNNNDYLFDIFEILRIHKIDFRNDEIDELILHTLEIL